MKITRIVEKTVSIASPIRNAFIDFSKMTISLLAIETDVIRDGRPVVGYGFNSNGRYAQGGIIRERLVPRIMEVAAADLLDQGGENFDPRRIYQVMMSNEKPGGHGERSVAVGTVDMAVWDLVAKIEGKPLYQLLAERYRQGISNKTVHVYAAGGYYYPGKAISGLQEEFQRYLDLGFDACKMKVGGASTADDMARIEAAIQVVGAAQRVAVDVNGRFDLPQALDFLRHIEPLGLMWYEEAVDPLDFLANAAVAEASDTPIATGENIFSLVDARNLARHGGLHPGRDLLQIDPVLSYGLCEYLDILDMLQRHGWQANRCIPHGGHLFGVHVAAGLGLYGMEAYPEVFAPYGHFAEGMVLEGGQVTLPDAPGIGYERVPTLYPELRDLPG